ncbi:hypothetical protein XH87_23505 [Bradyrhizobium sp. CCBAU 53415]|nr:hypothetical protein [Bradyrhizobium sp. CCBAU 53415]
MPLHLHPHACAIPESRDDVVGSWNRGIHTPLDQGATSFLWCDGSKIQYLSHRAGIDHYVSIGPGVAALIWFNAENQRVSLSEAVQSGGEHSAFGWKRLSPVVIDPPAPVVCLSYGIDPGVGSRIVGRAAKIQGRGHQL